MAAAVASQPANIEMNDDEGFTPGPFDVLCGRDRASFNHEGNRKFRAVVQVCLPRYRATKNRAEKAQIADYIEAGVHEKGGRFLKQDNHGVFRELNRVGRREKITHALRDAIKKEQDTRNKRENRIHLLHQACQWQVEKDAEGGDNKKPSKDRIQAIQDACKEAMKEEEKKEDAPSSRDDASQGNDTTESETEPPKEPSDGRKDAYHHMSMEAAMAQQRNFAHQHAAFAAQRLHHPFAGPLGMMHGPPVVSPMSSPADGSIVPPGLALLEKVSAQMDGPKEADANGAALGIRKGENALLAFKGLQAQASMSGMNTHQQAAFWQEQTRVMSMMLAMREQEIGVLKQSLWESVTASTAKDKEIYKLKEELAIKDRTLRMQRRKNQEDPPEDDE